MLARVYSKKKKRPLVLTDGDSGSAEYSAGMPRPPMMQHQQHQQQQHQHQQGSYDVAPPRTSRMSRVSHVFGGGKEKDGEQRKTTGLVKRVFGKKEQRAPSDYGAAKFNGGGVMYSEEDECDFDEHDHVESEEEEEEPEMLRPRRRFVRSGLSTYEQLISKNSMGRRFSRRSASDKTPSPMTDPTTGRKTTVVGGPASPVYDENSPVNREERGASGDVGKATNMSSLSSALQEVIHSRPTALKSVVDPSARPTRVQKSFVVEQNANGDFFVASRRVPDQPVRQTKDDSFIETMAATDAEFQLHQAAAAPGRRSDMDFLYRNKRSSSNALATVSGTSPGTTVSSTATLLAMGKAGIRRRLSGADRGMDTISNTPIATAGPPGRRSSNAGKARDPHYTGQTVMNHMAMMYMDHMRNRSASQTSDGYPAIIRGRKESTAMLQARSSFEDIDAVPMSMEDLMDSKPPTVDAGPMTMDEFMFDAPPPPPPPPIVRKNSGGKSSRSKRASSKAEIVDKEEEEEVENMFTQSFRNLKDVDALKRSRSFEEDEKVTTTTEETETEEEYPDYAQQRNTDDYGSSYDSSNYGSSYEDDAAVRTSNISEFLGGFKSRNSMNRNSLGGRNSAGRNSDFVSRAARSLRNSRKVAQESAKISSELSRKLREARARVPMDLRGEPHTAHKKRGFLSREGKRVRFDMNNYIREFEVIEPEPSDDDNEVQRWQQRDSEMDDDEDEEDEEEYENSTDDDCGDFGVPIPGAVLKAAMNDATAFYSNMPPASTTGMAYGAPARMSNGGAKRAEEDKRVSVVSRKSNGNQFEILL